MYLREPRRRNRDGTTVSYLQLAHNRRDLDTGVSRADILHSFGRADQVDRYALARLVASISRFLDPADAATAEHAAAAVERTLFAMVANRLSAAPASKRAGCGWVADRVFIEGLETVTDDACYRAEDFLLNALEQLQRHVFFTVANLLNLEVDLLLVDTTSTLWHTDTADYDPDDPALDHDDGDGGDGSEELAEAAIRRRGPARTIAPTCPRP